MKEASITIILFCIDDLQQRIEELTIQAFPELMVNKQVMEDRMKGSLLSSAFKAIIA